MPLLSVKQASEIVGVDENVLTRGRWDHSIARWLLLNELGAGYYTLCYRDTHEIFCNRSHLGDQKCCLSQNQPHLTIFQYCNGKRPIDFVIECCDHYDQRTNASLPHRTKGPVHDVAHGCEMDFDKAYDPHDHGETRRGQAPSSKPRYDMTLVETRLVHNSGVYSDNPTMVIQGHLGLARSLYFDSCDGQLLNALGEPLKRDTEKSSKDWTHWLHDGELPCLFCLKKAPKFWITHKLGQAWIHINNPGSGPLECDDCGDYHTPLDFRMEHQIDRED